MVARAGEGVGGACVGLGWSVVVGGAGGGCRTHHGRQVQDEQGERVLRPLHKASRGRGPVAAVVGAVEEV